MATKKYSSYAQIDSELAILKLEKEIHYLRFLVEMGISKMMRWIYVYTGSAVKGVRLLKGALVPQKYRIRRTWTAARVGASRT
jgi:hypothetical protein